MSFNRPQVANLCFTGKAFNTVLLTVKANGEVFVINLDHPAATKNGVVDHNAQLPGTIVIRSAAGIAKRCLYLRQVLGQ